MEITSFSGRLNEYTRENNGHLPENISEWLNQNFKSPQKSDMSVDYFGTAYKVTTDKETSREFLCSCGPDRECRTVDDIELK